MTRTTTHAGKGTARHNFREFPTTAKGKSDIDRNLSHSNKFFVSGRFFDNELELKKFYQNQKKFFSNLQSKFKGDNRFKELSNTEKVELAFYDKFFNDTINKQHIRNEQRRQQCLNKSSLDMFLSKKTQPEETIFQIGNKDYCPVTADQLWDIYKDYQKKHNQVFGKNIRILDAVLHVDETTIHIHERKLYKGLNNHNEVCPSKDSALEQLGIERPNTNKPVSRYNNRKQTYSKQCREIWIDICKQHGLDIQTEPQIYKDKKGLELIEYKVSQEQKKLDDLENKCQQKEQHLKQVDNQFDKAVKATYEQDKIFNSNREIINQKIIEAQQILDELSSKPEIDIMINQKTLDLMYDNDPDYVEYYQNIAKEQINQEFQLYNSDEIER